MSSRTGGEGCTGAVEVFRDLERAPPVGAFIEHVGGEGGQSWLINRVGLAAAQDHQVGGNDRQVMALNKQHREAVGQFEAAGDRQRELRSRSFSRLLLPPVGLRIRRERLRRLRLLLFRGLRRIVDCLLTLHGLDDYPRSRGQFLLCEFLYCRRRNSVVAREVLRKVIRCTQVMLYWFKRSA